MLECLKQVEKKILTDEDISWEDANNLLDTRDSDLPFLFALSNLLREKKRGKKVNFCSIVNAKSGACPEDCAFCSQSVYHHTNVPIYPLISAEEMVKKARKANEIKASRFCIVISGRGIETEEEVDTVCSAFLKIKSEFPHLLLDASMGFISQKWAEKLKSAGLIRYNHNLETTESFFKNICSTHTYQKRVETIKMLKGIGLEVCCGGIFGLGETPTQQLKFAFALRDLDVDCVPLNFLNPIAGTRLENTPPLSPLEILRLIAIYRLILPTVEIRICGGREKRLRSLQPIMFLAGADAAIIGDYLTTSGAHPEDDLQMVEDLGLKLDGV